MRTERGRVPDEPGDGRPDRAAHAGRASRRSIPQIDLTGGGRYPVFGASHHVEAATARHDRVAWTFASGATARGVHVIQHRPVTGLLRDGGRRRVVGVETAAGDDPGRRRPVGGRRAGRPRWRRGRRPPADPDAPAPRVRHERLRAGPRQDRRLDRARLLRQPDRARPDAHRGRVRQPAVVLADLVVRRAPELRLQDHACSCRSSAPMRILRTWAGLCDISADWSPIMGETGVDGFLITTGWGTWGFKAIPAGGEALAELIATGRTPELIAPFALERFRRDHVLADQASAGTALMHELDCPRCGRRPLDEFVFGGERRTVPSPIEDADARDFDEVWIFDNPDGIDDRALVPRRGLPALADGPPRHVGRPRARDRDDVRRLRRAAARDPRPRPGAVRRRRRSRSCRASVARSRRVVGVRRHRSGRRPVGRRRSRRRPACAARASRSSVFDGVEPNPGTASIERGSDGPPGVPRRPAGRRVVVGLGGGSAMDSAKVDRPPRSQSACCHVTWLPR